MAKYLYQASYVGEGIKGLLAEGATSRVSNSRPNFNYLILRKN